MRRGGLRIGRLGFAPYRWAARLEQVRDDLPVRWKIIRAPPEQALEQRQFFAMLEACVERLSPRLARIFMMREWLERDVDDICAELGITANNCHVMLFRARMSLRECVDLQWFGKTP